VRYLVDNMVPRSVTRLLRRRGLSALEVREALAANAPDAVIAAYAQAEGRVVITHDRVLAERCLRDGLPHLWLRTREADDAERLDGELDRIEGELIAGAVRTAVVRLVPG
jgi:predicted nuclease of predicted toxin-antitoxin system